MKSRQSELNIHHTEGVNVNHLRFSVMRDVVAYILPVKNSMPVQHKTRLCHLQKEVDGSQAAVCLIIVVMDPVRRRMGHQDVQSAVVQGSLH